MNTDYLKPGYVEKAILHFQAQSFFAVEDLKSKNKILGHTVSLPAFALSVAVSCLAIPFILIEDVTLTAINLVGAAFSKGCRKNLLDCVIRLAINTAKFTINGVAIIIYPKLFLTITVLALAVFFIGREVNSDLMAEKYQKALGQQTA